MIRSMRSFLMSWYCIEIHRNKRLPRSRARAGRHFRPLLHEHGNAEWQPLREPINRALLKIMESDEWEKRVAHYTGSGG